jgi:dsDNA-binding SOS-regulon protein
MTTSNSPYNPIFRATRAALHELTTPQAQYWYAQQLRAGATLAQTLTLKAIMNAQHLLNARTPATTAFAEPGQSAIEATAPANEPVLEVITSADLTLSEAVELEQDVSRSPWSRDEVNDHSAVDDYELLLDESELIPDDDLESSPPLVQEPQAEDISFYLPDEDVEADSSQDEIPLDAITQIEDVAEQNGYLPPWAKTEVLDNEANKHLHQ